MKTRNVFIDTCIFVGKNYNYRATEFRQLSRLANLDRANVVATDITIREVEARLDADVSMAIRASKSFQKGAKPLRNIDRSPCREIFQEIDEEKIKKSAEKPTLDIP